MGLFYRLNEHSAVYGIDKLSMMANLKQIGLVSFGEERLSDDVYMRIQKGEYGFWNFTARRKLFFIVSAPFKVADFLARTIYSWIDNIPQWGLEENWFKYDTMMNDPDVKKEVKLSARLNRKNLIGQTWGWFRFTIRVFLALMIGFPVFLLTCLTSPIDEVFHPLIQELQRKYQGNIFQKVLVFLVSLLIAGTAALLILPAFFGGAAFLPTVLKILNPVAMMVIAGLTSLIAAWDYARRLPDQILPEEKTRIRLGVVPCLISIVFLAFAPSLLLSVSPFVGSAAVHLGSFLMPYLGGGSFIIAKIALSAAVVSLTAAFWHYATASLIPNSINSWRLWNSDEDAVYSSQYAPSEAPAPAEEPSVVSVSSSGEQPSLIVHKVVPWAESNRLSRLYYNTPETLEPVEYSKQGGLDSIYSLLGGHSLNDVSKLKKPKDFVDERSFSSIRSRSGA